METISAVTGGSDQLLRIICDGVAGIAGGAMLFETRSKMPALLRSLKRVASKVALSAGVCGSCEPDAKSAAAIRILVAPRLVPVRTQSCALAVGEAPSSAAVVTTKRAENKETGKKTALCVYFCHAFLMLLPADKTGHSFWMSRTRLAVSSRILAIIFDADVVLVIAGR